MTVRNLFDAWSRNVAARAADLLDIEAVALLRRFAGSLRGWASR
ncbi:hypothetical protein [Lysobacter enzymogenes]|nr:hypothetical protein [Lysobacter enzymogenes]UZW62729.1 hypothetical protein BV903_010740 [Lysobacter enzymogenes]